MTARLSVRPGDMVIAVDATAIKTGKRTNKPTFGPGEELRVFKVTADGRAIAVHGHSGLWLASRFKLP